MKILSIITMLTVCVCAVALVILNVPQFIVNGGEVNRRVEIVQAQQAEQKAQEDSAKRERDLENEPDPSTNAAPSTN